MLPDKSKKILLVTQSERFAFQLGEYLTDIYTFTTLSDLEEVVRQVTVASPDLVLLDHDLAGVNSLDFLRRLKKIDIRLKVILFSEAVDIQAAVTSIKMGGADFLSKPVDPDKLLTSIRKVLKQEPRDPFLKLEKVPDRLWFCYRSKVMEQFLQEVDVVSRTDSDGVIVSEAGLDQISVAKLIHDNTPSLAKRRFVRLDLEAFAHEAAESHLWGTLQKILQEPDIATLQTLAERTGTLFLGHFERLLQHFQESLLAFLQSRRERTYQGNIDKEIRVILGLSNASELPAQMLKVVIPPLRERREDLPLLFSSYVQLFCQEFGRDLPGFAKGILDDILYYDWPGNLWEFKNVLRLSILSTEDGKLLGAGGLGDVRMLIAKHIEKALASDAWDLQSLRNHFERELVQKLLAGAHGDRDRVSELLDLPKTVFDRKLTTLDLASETS